MGGLCDGRAEEADVTMENMMEVATTATQFSQFEGASSALLLHCAHYYNKKVTQPSDRVEYMVAQNAEGNGVVALTLLSLAQALPPSEGTICQNCKERDCLAGQEVPQSKLVKGLKVMTNPKNSYEDYLQDLVVFSVTNHSVALNYMTGVTYHSNFPPVFAGVPTLLYDC